MMGNLYSELKKRHQAEINDFPLGFAFSQQQLEESMEKLGAKYKSELRSIGAGGFVHVDIAADFVALMDRQTKEMEEAILSDRTGDGFIYDMFLYELANHEYGYTREIEDTLDALGLDYNELESNPALLYGLKKACAALEDE